MRVINTTEVNTEYMAGLTTEEKLWIYNGFDNIGTRCIKKVLFKHFDDDTIDVYNFEVALQAPAMSMMRRGFNVDNEERLRLIAEIRPRLLALGGMERPNPKKPYKVTNPDALIQQYAKAIWGKTINYNSPVQLKSLLYDNLRLPTQYKYEKGKKKVSTQRDVLEVDTPKFIIESDATIVAPLIFAYLLGW